MPLNPNTPKDAAATGFAFHPMTIRHEKPADQPSISQIITSAFATMPYADGDEADLVDVLRSSGALSVSLVCEIEGKVVGHIAFSPATAQDSAAPWYALGPVAVQPDLQGRGIGAALVRAGMQIVADRGAHGVMLTGDPNYYTRFGFERSPDNAPRGEPAEFFMVKLLSGSRVDGPIAFHPAFGSAD